MYYLLSKQSNIADMRCDKVVINDRDNLLK